MWYLAAYIAGCVTGVFCTVALAALYQRATDNPREAGHDEPDTQMGADHLTMTYAQLLRYRELVDEHGNLRRH